MAPGIIMSNGNRLKMISQPTIRLQKSRKAPLSRNRPSASGASTGWRNPSVSPGRPAEVSNPRQAERRETTGQAIARVDSAGCSLRASGGIPFSPVRIAPPISSSRQRVSGSLASRASDVTAFMRPNRDESPSLR